MGFVRELGLAAVFALVGCGANTYVSTPLDFPLTGSAKDAQGSSTLTEQTSLAAAESGYPDFIGHVREAFGGDPARLEIVDATLGITANKNLNSLDKVFAKGKVSVVFQLDGSDVEVPVAEVTDVSGSQVTLTVDFRPDALSPTQLEALFAGGASVVLKGPIASSFARSSNVANLDLSFTFKAYK